METEPLPKVGTAFAVTAMVKVRLAWSPEAMLLSASSAVMVTVWAAPAVVGVPQISRASVPVQPGESVPVASNTRPSGRLEAV